MPIDPTRRGMMKGLASLGVVVGTEAAAVIDSGGSIVEAQAFIAAIAEAPGTRRLTSSHPCFWQ